MSLATQTIGGVNANASSKKNRRGRKIPVSPSQSSEGSFDDACQRSATPPPSEVKRERKSRAERRSYRKKQNCPVRAQHNRECNNFPLGSRLFISFSKPLNEEELRHLFEAHGVLEKAFLFPGKHYGFAKFTTAEAATRATEEINGKCVNGIQCRAVVASEQLSRDDVKKPSVDAAKEESPAQLRNVRRCSGSSDSADDSNTAGTPVKVPVVAAYRHDPYSMDGIIYIYDSSDSDSSDELTE